MAKAYRALTDIYLGKKAGGFVHAGTVFQFAGKPNKNMVEVSEKEPSPPAEKGKAKGAERKDEKPAVAGKSSGDKEVI